jgi:hypothetical protein
MEYVFKKTVTADRNNREALVATINSLGLNTNLTAYSQLGGTFFAAHLYVTEGPSVHNALFLSDGILVGYDSFPPPTRDFTESDEKEIESFDNGLPPKITFLSAKYPDSNNQFCALSDLYELPQYKNKPCCAVFTELFGNASDYLKEAKDRPYAQLVEEVKADNGQAHKMIQSFCKQEENRLLLETTDDPEITRLRTIRKAKRADLPTFMNTEGAYTMREYLFAVKAKIGHKAYESLQKVASVLSDNEAKDLYNAQAKYNVLDVLTGERAAFLSAIQGLNVDPIVQNARTPEEVAKPDSVLARLPQCREKSTVYIELGNVPHAHSNAVLLNLCDSQGKVNVIPPSNQMAQVARALPRITSYVKDFVFRTNKAMVSLVPAPPRSATDYTNYDLRALANLKLTKNASDPSTVNLIPNTHGQRLFSNFTKTLDVSVLTRIVAKGLQDVDFLHQAYKSSPVFRQQWQEVLTKFKEDDPNTQRAYDQYVKYEKALIGCYCYKRNKYCVNNPVADLEKYKDLTVAIEELHELNRNYIVANGADVSTVASLHRSLTVMPSDSFFITMMNDLLFEGSSVEAYRSLDYLNVGHLLNTDREARPQAYPGEKVSYHTEWLDKYDTSPSKVRGLIDLRNEKKTQYYVGGGTTLKEKITAKDNEKRGSIYYDYEPVPASYRGGVKHFAIVHENDDQQWARARQALDADAEIVATVVPLRWLEKACSIYPIVFAFPAPLPFNMCAYVIAQKGAKNVLGRDHVVLVVTVVFMKMILMMEMIETGLGIMVQLFEEQMEIESSDFAGDLITRWWILLSERFVGKIRGSPSKTVSNDIRLLLKSDEKAQKADVVRNVLANSRVGYGNWGFN